MGESDQRETPRINGLMKGISASFFCSLVSRIIYETRPSVLINYASQIGTIVACEASILRHSLP